MKNLLISILIICFGLPLIGQTFGNAIDLDGIDDYAIVPHHASLNPFDGSWSVAFWINAADKDQIAPVVMKRLPEPPYTQYSYAFGKDDPHDPEPGKRIRVNHIDDAGISERSGHTTAEFIDGEWHHLVIVANKEQDVIIIYVDGIAVEFVSLYYFGLWPNVETDFDLIIASGSSGSKIEGIMDELSIWNRALDHNHIQQFMHDTLSPEYYYTADSGLVAYYRFDEFEDLGINGGGSDDFRDLSVWQNHADSEGGPVLIPSGIAVSIDKRGTLINIKIFPNPAIDIIRFEPSRIQHEDGPAVIEIYDLKGSKLIEKQIPAGTENVDLDVSSLKSGVYFYRNRTICWQL